MKTIQDGTVMQRLVEQRILFSAPEGQECTNDFHKSREPAEWIFRSNWRSDPFKGYASCARCLPLAEARITRAEEPPHFRAQGCLLSQKCWKCKEVGILFVIGFLQYGNGSIFCESALNIMREPFISLLREYFLAHPDQRARFGRVKLRWVKSFGKTVLSQGCPHCDTHWSFAKLQSGYLREYDDMLRGVPHRVGTAIFPCDAKHVLPVVHPWFNRMFSEGRFR
jgi:hypothetical protein